MAKTKISEYSSTANSNTDIASINIDEGCAPSGINNAIRALMAQIHDLYAGTSGDTWPVTAGGTGSGTASGARTNLGLVIGTDVQAYDADLAAIASSGKGAEIASYGTYGVGFKNRIINGAMMIDQRNAGAAVTTTYPVDRFAPQYGSGTLTFQQTTSVVPAGFAYALGITVTSAGTRNAGDYFNLYQNIEGLNVSDLGFGAANAATATLSFWVRSSVTGTYSGVLASGDNTRSYAFTYSISSANTWTQISVTIAGDTSGGQTAYPINNTTGLRLKLDLGSGSNYQISSGSWQAATNKIGATGSVGWAQTAGATFYITGVQLEKGSTATSFDYRPYGTELALCQRYYAKTFTQTTAPAQNAGSDGTLVGSSSVNNVSFGITWLFPVTMRSSPSVTTFAPDAASSNWSDQGGQRPTAAVLSAGQTSAGIRGTTSVNAGGYYTIHATASAEL